MGANPAGADPLSAFDAFIAQHGLFALVGAAAVLFVGGFAKGVVGFALPLVAISGLGAFLPAPTAVALFILPALVSNTWQMFRDGWGPAMATLWRFRLLIAVLLPGILFFSQFLTVIDERLFFVALGALLIAFALSQLAGWRATFMARWPQTAQVGAGLVGGVGGGLFGVWGPPVTMYLLACETPKAETMRALGLVFALGSITLTGAHLASGVLNAVTVPLSMAGVVPVMVGMALGYAVHDKMDARAFKRATLVVLALAGVNLMRRAVEG